jgi:large subunit ribosomal protein L4
MGIPRKVRQLAKKSALNARAREGSLLVIDPPALEKPKTKPVAALLAKLGVAGQNVLLLTAAGDGARTLHLAARNIDGVRVRRFADATAYDVLWSAVVVVELPALGEGTAAVEGGDDA